MEPMTLGSPPQSPVPGAYLNRHIIFCELIQISPHYIHITFLYGRCWLLQQSSPALSVHSLAHPPAPPLQQPTSPAAAAAGRALPTTAVWAVSSTAAAADATAAAGTVWVPARLPDGGSSHAEPLHTHAWR